MKVISALTLLLSAQLCLGQQIPKELKKTDAVISNLIKKYRAAGLSVAVVKDNKVIYSKGFGYRDLEDKLPANDSTVFHIASMTKAFTGTLLGVLESEGQLSLHDKPALHVPNFQFYNEKMDNLITIGDLLSHRSGIGNQGSSIVMFPEKDKLKTVQRLRYLKPEGEIKDSWIYSNLGYTLAGTIAEQITNKSWDINIKERILNPLHMNSSYTTTEEMEKTNNFSKGYAMHNGKIENVPFEDYYSYTPAGALKSSVKDLSNWMLAWLNNGVFNKNQVIPKKYVREATTLKNMKNDIYEKDAFLWGEGYGWRLRAWHGHYRVRHGGNTNGFSTLMDLYPFENIGIVVLTNQKSSLLPYAISDYISRKLMELPDFEFPVVVHDMYKAKTKAETLNKEKMPSHSIEEFVGTYQANGFGTIKIIKENKTLFAVLPTFKFQLAHLNYNRFYLKGTEEFTGDFNPEFTIEFTNNHKGVISQLKLYSQKEPIEFNRE
ncbi:serine hydrolase [Flagellimonas pacifica]|uniref:CubicO group peptidase, beta-lactamase class C family n=1 Tax=Flagellimonas pacifica TaxID=1247520 RepID=A0A285MX11_9FLAO|nr:serine hydrolase [Allomuricauda parva]SNZ00356.1 CubicO group peptidase, beta-lactamase class C family [Allomuricauda parva]